MISVHLGDKKISSIQYPLVPYLTRQLELSTNALQSTQIYRLNSFDLESQFYIPFCGSVYVVST